LPILQEARITAGFVEDGEGQPELVCQKLTVRETGAVSEQRSRKSVKTAWKRPGAAGVLLRVRASVPGAYFADEMRQAQEEGRICRLPIETGIR